MSATHDTPARRPERQSHQPLAEINKDEAKKAKPDPELGEHGPIVAEDGRNEHGRPAR